MRVVFALTAVAALSASAQAGIARVLDFEFGFTGVPVATTGLSVVNNNSFDYQGFRFGTSQFLGGLRAGVANLPRLNLTRSVGTPNGPSNIPSGDEVLLFAAGGGVLPELQLSALNGPELVRGAFFAGARFNGQISSFSVRNVTVRGFLNNALVGERTFALNFDAFEFVDFGFSSAVDRFVIIADRNNANFFVDNIVVVPAPSAAALLGLAGVVAARRRRA
ncbi:MAG: hypothetical protein C0475_08205 [Planctomyces sp.]|nr:hypothetical protein [Planctomyces sp.]MBA4119901.1 hypothetical protein [Isosphaera sp.]